MENRHSTQRVWDIDLGTFHPAPPDLVASHVTSCLCPRAHPVKTIPKKIKIAFTTSRISFFFFGGLLIDSRGR